MYVLIVPYIMKNKITYSIYLGAGGWSWTSIQ